MSYRDGRKPLKTSIIHTYEVPTRPFYDALQHLRLLRRVPDLCL